MGNSIQWSWSSLPRQTMGLWTRFYEWLLSTFWAKNMDVTIVGLQNSGKTTLLTVLAGEKFTEDTIPTVGFSLREIKKGGVNLKCWDIGGQRRFQSMWERYARGAGAILYVVDSTDTDKFVQAREALHALVAATNPEHTPLLVLGNKNDLPDAVSVDDLIAEMDLQAVSQRELSCYSISAKEVTNLDAVVSWLVSKATKATKAK